MKIFHIILLFITLNSLFGQIAPATYANYQRINDSIDTAWDIDERISEIEFISKSKYEFRSYPIYSSCLTWRTYAGTWERINNTIFFYDQYEVNANDAQFSFLTDIQREFYHLKFKTDTGTGLTNKNINISFVYDLESDWNFDEYKMTLDDDFSLKIPFKSIPNVNKLASIRYLYYLENGERRFGFISADETLTEKENDLPNIIEVTLIEQPKKEIVKRITKATIVNEKIKIISTQKNKINLPDETPKLMFKEFYKKELKK